MPHRHTAQDPAAKAAARYALQQAYDWRDEQASTSRDMDEVLRGFETGLRYPACQTPKSATSSGTPASRAA